MALARALKLFHQAKGKRAAYKRRPVLMTQKQAAEFLGVTSQTVQYYRRTKRLREICPGTLRSVLIDAETVYALARNPPVSRRPKKGSR